MRTVVDCVSSFIPLLSTEYEIVLGRKNVAVKFIITFDKKDWFHLMGLQYLTDRPELRRDRGKIYFCFYLMQEMIVIFVVLFSQRRKWIIQRIKLHGLFYIRKKEILLMGQNIYYTID